MICILILVLFIAINSLDKAESVKVKLEETQLKTFDEIFGESWWDKDEAKDLKTPPPTIFGQNVHHQIDRQNTQIEPNSTDQNTSLTESDHSENAKNGEEQNETSSNENIAENDQKRKIVAEFHAIKEVFKQKGKYSKKEWDQIERKISDHLKVSRLKIYEWKKEFGLSRKMHNFGKKKEELKHFVEKFDQRKAELTGAGFKNSYNHEIDETVAKELGLSFATIYNWKRQLGQSTPNKYGHNTQKELMKRYYQIKDKTPKISDENIAKILKIGKVTLFRWKKQFNREQFQPNAVDGHFVEENAGPNVHEIRNSNSGSI